MAGISTTISRKDLEFMAEDIGPELVAVMAPEKVLEGMDTAKLHRLISFVSIEERLSGLSLDELVKGMSPERRKALFELVLKTLTAGLVSEDESN